jgi:hypothetical protein
MRPEDELPQALRRFLIADRDEEDGEVLDVTQAAARLDETPESIERWIGEKRLLAWRNVKGLRIPAEQIIGPHRIVPGIERVLEMMPSAQSAWDFLRLESPFFPGEPQRPLDALKNALVSPETGSRSRDARRDLTSGLRQQSSQQIFPPERCEWEGCGTSFACRRVALRADGRRRVMICLPVRHHLLSGQTFCVNICLNIRAARERISARADALRHHLPARQTPCVAISGRCVMIWLIVRQHLAEPAMS